MRKPYEKHGELKITKEYRAWLAIKQRCTNKKHPRFKDYGKRGITICDVWANSYKSFLEDMGRAPSIKHTIDRINNDGNYEPGNCRWATYLEQNLNKSSNRTIIFNGKPTLLIELCKSLNLNYRAVYHRIYTHGWPVEKAFSKSIRIRSKL